MPFLKQVTTGHLREKFVAVDMAVKVRYSKPEAVFHMDNTQDPPVIKVAEDADAADADVEMAMSADDGHKLWLGSLNVPMALGSRKIKISGPLMKMLSLLPVFQPAFAEYRKYLQSSGHVALL
ncbi:MAG TPA: SCP2 sterol-binding domain-containing protein [Pseudonocardiaceae bacterium]|nr:SCP2 sterol-binding domain-containing protein [Pseudonocardiaceae bacterium]